MSDIYDDFQIFGKVGDGTGFGSYKVLGTSATENALLYHAPFYSFSEQTVGLINNTTTQATFLTLNVDVPQTGLYLAKWHYVWSLNDGAQDIIVNVNLDGTTNLGYRDHRQEPKDTAGTGENLGLVGGGTLNTSTDQRHFVEGSRPLSGLTAGSHSITLNWNCSAVGDRAALYGAYISLERKG